MKSKLLPLIFVFALTPLLTACDKEKQAQAGINPNTGMAHQTNTAQQSDEEIYKKLHNK